MRFIVLAHGPMLEGRRIDRDAPNPGIGGTQFTRLRLADAFAAQFPQHTVEVVSDHRFELTPPLPNLRLTLGVPIADRLADLPGSDDDWVVTGPSMLLRHLDPRLLRAIGSHTIITSHLMHDADLWEAERHTRFAAAGCVGAFHHHASRSRSPRVHLRNLFLPGWEPADPATAAHLGRAGSDPRDDAGVFRVVHVGALLPLKGFHDLARIWPAIRAAIPRARLDVIGGSDVYGRAAEHPLLPTSRALGDEILRHIPAADVEDGHVVFHGGLGAEKVGIVRHADVAVLNVAGREECFPAAALECLDLGVPVVGSARYGLWDSMRHFPETTTRSPDEVVTRLAALADDRSLRAALAARAVEVARGFRAENAAILANWEAVATAALRGVRPDPFTPPAPPLPAWIHTAEHLRRRARYGISRSQVGATYRRVKRRLRLT